MSEFILYFENTECNICYEEDKNLFVKTKCSHEMCNECYKNISHICPFCRMKIEKNTDKSGKILYININILRGLANPE